VLNDPVYIPIPHEKFNNPSSVGVNSIVSSPLVGNRVLTPKLGIMKLLAQLWTLLLTTFSLTGIPLFQQFDSHLQF